MPAKREKPESVEINSQPCSEVVNSATVCWHLRQIRKDRLDVIVVFEFVDEDFQFFDLRFG